MSPLIVVSTLIAYFSLLIIVSYFTNRSANTDSFYTGNKQSPWFVVSFGMIGASLSGVTFLSIPGTVLINSFSYLQMVIGFFFGYLLIAYVLLPIYYKLKLVSIYEYLGHRFNKTAQKVGSSFFLLSRLIGASLRLLLVAIVLDKAIFSFYDVPFFVTVLVTILLIWSYTFQGGIKTVVWTDTFQTGCMLISLVITVVYLGFELSTIDISAFQLLKNAPLSKVFFWTGDYNFFSFFFTGVFITVVMTGLDQDMMQKNLTVDRLRNSQKNMLFLGLNLIIVNFFFLVLGAFLFLFASSNHIEVPKMNDLVFAELALNHLPLFIGVPFVLGTVAAAYSSADSALTSLTTSFVFDFLRPEDNGSSTKTRMKVHAAFSLILFVMIVAAKAFVSGSIVWDLFQMAGLTYGPLLGLFAVGVFTKWQLRGQTIVKICISSFAVSLLIYFNSELLMGVQLKTSIALFSTSITVIFLYLFRIKSVGEQN